MNKSFGEFFQPFLNTAELPEAVVPPPDTLPEPPPSRENFTTSPVRALMS